MTRTAIVFGAGPGIGDHIAAAFATKGIDHIILLARNLQRLQNEDAPFVSKASSNVKVDSVRIDLSDTKSIPSALKELDTLTKGEDVEVIVFNAARIKPSETLTTDVEELHEDLNVSVLALYIISQHYIPQLQALTKSKSSSKPALLVTNSHLPWDPVPELISLSLSKAAQRNMVWSLHRKFSKDVQIGLISVEGQVSPEMKMRNPRNIAEMAVGFWERGDRGVLEVNVREEDA